MLLPMEALAGRSETTTSTINLTIDGEQISVTYFPFSSQPGWDHPNISVEPEAQISKDSDGYLLYNNYHLTLDGTNLVLATDTPVDGGSYTTVPISSLDFTAPESLSMRVTQGQSDLAIDPCVITNTGAEDLKLSKVEITAASGWTVVNASTDFTTAESKNKIAFTAGGHDFADGAYTPNEKITAGSNTTLQLAGKISEKADLTNATQVASMVVTVEKDSLPYLSFLGNEDFTLKTYKANKGWDGTLEYSTDASTWSTWDGTEISSAGSKLYLRGTGNSKITGSSSYRFVFTGTSALKIACEGNIESLLDCRTVKDGGHPTMANSCYSTMFFNCTSLTTAPELPATTLTYGCYQNMFSGCVNLVAAPALPATTLNGNCYIRMFQGCTSLTTAPELPATTLTSGCYSQMFFGCTALTTLPALPAPALANGCYQDMFQGCSLIKLSTSKTGAYTTAYRIPISGTGTTATNALSSMFTSTGGTFTGTPSINTTYYTSNTVV